MHRNYLIIFAVWVYVLASTLATGGVFIGLGYLVLIPLSFLFFAGSYFQRPGRAMLEQGSWLVCPAEGEKIIGRVVG